MTPDIQVIEQVAAALIKITKKGRDQIVEALSNLTKPGYEVSVGENDARIVFKLIWEYR
jgi:hypothetical protein